MAEPARPYTAAELAEHWRCSTSHIYDEIRRGAIPKLPAGRRMVRIPRAFVEATDRGEEWELPENMKKDLRAREASAAANERAANALRLRHVIERRQSRRRE